MRSSSGATSHASDETRSKALPIAVSSTPSEGPPAGFMSCLRVRCDARPASAS